VRPTTRRARSAPLALLALSLAEPACFVAERHIDTTVRDPGAVSLHADSATGQAPSTVLPGDGQPERVTVATGTFETGESSSASFELDADRLPDRTIRLRWVHPPVIGGEIETVLPASGRIRIPDTDDVEGTIDLHAPTLRIPIVATISRATGSHGSFLGYAAGVRAPSEVPGGSGVDVFTSLQTPWSNVVEIRRRVIPYRGLMLGLLILNSVFWGGFGGAYIAAAPSFGPGTSGETAFRAVGWSSIAVGSLIDLLLLPTILGPETNEVVFAGH
jgi:hypothetical protein